MTAPVDDVPVVPIDDRGLTYGDGLFETLRVTAEGAPLHCRHRARMAHGAARLGIAFDPQEFDSRLRRLVAERGAGVVKLILTRGSGGRGYRPPVTPAPRLMARWFPLPSRPAHWKRAGLTLGLCRTRLPSASHLEGLKHLNRLDQVLAAGEVQQHGWDEGLMLDQSGRPQELTAMNLFARFGSCLWTPAAAAGGVAGILQQWVLEQAGVLGLQPLRRPLSLARLREADEVFAGNSVAGILPVRKLAVWSWPVGDTTGTMQEAFDSLFGDS